MGKYARNGLRLAKGAKSDLTGFDQVARSDEFRHMFWKYPHIAGIPPKYGRLSL
jgi:hypothetical protein